MIGGLSDRQRRQEEQGIDPGVRAMVEDLEHEAWTLDPAELPAVAEDVARLDDDELGGRESGARCE